MSRSLTDEQAERVREGVCACGCGKPIPAGSRSDRITAERRCRNRLHRSRAAEGLALTADARKRATLERSAAEDESRAAELEEQARAFVARAQRLRARARRRREEALGSAQLALEVSVVRPPRSLEQARETPGNPDATPNRPET